MTACSSVSHLQKVWLRPPANPSQDELDQANWEPIVIRTLHDEFHHYHQLLSDLHIDVVLLPPAQNPDGIYLYDTMLHTKWGVIVFQSPKKNRIPESEEILAYLQEHNISILGRIGGSGTIDGGDVCWLSPTCLVVGISWRSNREGAHQLRYMLSPFGIEVRMYDIPNLFGSQVCLHLMSLISPLRPDLALVYPQALPTRLYQDLLSDGYTLIAVPEEEWDIPNQPSRLATNVLSLGQNRAISVAGNPITAQRIREQGFTLFELDAPNLCNAGTGGPTCLTVAVYRA